MTPEQWLEIARKVVAGWPPVTEQESRELTNIAMRHHERKRQEEQRKSA